MGDVYSNAFITIVPICPTSALDDFLCERQYSDAPLRIEYPVSGSPPLFDHFYADHVQPDTISKRDRLTNGMWNTRAWIFSGTIIVQALALLH